MGKTFDLYIDESGNFSENELTRQHQNFANQLAGILVPANEFSEVKAEQILRKSYQDANYHNFPTNAVHGCQLAPGYRYDCLINSLVAQIQHKKWQPVRLVNQERVNYGDPVSNYVNMLAELALRIFQQESSEGAERVTINFYCAYVSINGRRTISEDEYRRSLKNYQAFAAVRLGLAAKSSHWKIGRLKLLNANQSRRLQICDLLSNASHNQYQKCGEQTALILKEAFCVYDQTLVRHPLLEKLNLLIDEGFFGLAIRIIAEQAVKEPNNIDTQQKMFQGLDTLIDTLANLSATERDSHLNIVTAWLEQIIRQQRSLDLGYEIILWLRENFEQPLIARLGNRKNSLSWFTYALHCWILTICNHQGNLEQARQEIHAMQKLIPDLAENWELVPLLMRGFVLTAVHHTDCWEYYEVAKSMISVYKYYRDLSSLFIDALPEIFPQKIRSHLEAKALGTWLQSEIHASAFLPHRVSSARNISDACIYKFANIGDKQRQYQYRTQLETIAQEFGEARKYLAMSLGLSECSHQAIAQKITTLTKISQGFALLHWLRLGTTAFLSDDSSEWSEFSSALEQSRLLYTDWCHGKQSVEYPTLGILRRVALINIIWSRPDAALGRLRNLNPVGNKNIVFGAIQIATYAEVAALQWQKNLKKAKLLLDCPEPKKLGIRQLIEIISEKSKHNFPRFWQLNQLWYSSIDKIINEAITNEQEVRIKLIEIGTSVNY